MYALAPEPAELKPADVEPILPSEPVSRCGDLWLLGRHRLMCGDATERSQVTRLLDGAQPSLMVTDPPYGVAYDASWRKKAFGSSGGRLGKVRNDDDPGYWAAALEACKTPVAYIWSPSGGKHIGLRPHPPSGGLRPAKPNHLAQAQNGDQSRALPLAARVSLVWGLERKDSEMAWGQKSNDGVGHHLGP